MSGGRYYWITPYLCSREHQARWQFTTPERFVVIQGEAVDGGFYATIAPEHINMLEEGAVRWELQVDDGSGFQAIKEGTSFKTQV